MEETKEVLQKIIEKSKGDLDVIVQEAIRLDPELTGSDYTLGGWGSFQYQTACDLFVTLLHFVSVFGDEVYKMLGINLSLGEPASKETFLKKFKEDIKEYYKDYDDYDDYIRNKLEKMNLKNVDHCFETLKELSWDLWGASRFIFERIYPDAEYEIWNRIAQSDNFRVGLHCFILYNKNFVRREESFAHFDA